MSFFMVPPTEIEWHSNQGSFFVPDGHQFNKNIRHNQEFTETAGNARTPQGKGSITSDVPASAVSV
jgi:hypothetical protein